MQEIKSQFLPFASLLKAVSCVSRTCRSVGYRVGEVRSGLKVDMVIEKPRNQENREIKHRPKENSRDRKRQVCRESGLGPTMIYFLQEI